MLRRISTTTQTAVAARFCSVAAAEGSIPAAPVPKYDTVVSSSNTLVSAGGAKGKKGNLTELEIEYRQKAEDPQGLPTTRATQTGVLSGTGYIYNRGRNTVPTPAELAARNNCNRYLKGQILTKSNLHMMHRHELKDAFEVHSGLGQFLPSFDHVTASGSGVAVTQTQINPLEHDMVYHGKKDLRYGTVKRQLGGGTYMRL